MNHRIPGWIVLILFATATAVLGGETFPVVRTPVEKRKFRSEAVERTIREIKSSIGNNELAWLFENCFPNTLDTTVDFEMIGRRPDTYVITGDIDAMWLRDSTAQVWPYLPLMGDDDRLRLLIQGVINRHTRCILKDPYANAFYKDESRVSEWHNDVTLMKPGVHERKWELDSLCYPIRLAHRYWKQTGDTTPLDADWRHAMKLAVRTMREQQRKTSPGPYSFRRGNDVLANRGYGNPAKPNGLICSMFRPSDDNTIFPYLIPSNFMAVVSLRQAAEMLAAVSCEANAAECRKLADEVEQALRQYAVVRHPRLGDVYAFEIDGFGGRTIMDDANLPNLLSLPYFGAVKSDDPVYRATRQLVLSDANPYFVRGKAAEGLGGPHAGPNMIWPLGIMTRALTSNDDQEIRQCLRVLQKSHAGTGFMHEAFDRDDPNQFTRKWFAWANSLFGELVLKVHRERPALLD